MSLYAQMNKWETYILALIWGGVSFFSIKSGIDHLDLYELPGMTFIPPLIHATKSMVFGVLYGFVALFLVAKRRFYYKTIGALTFLLFLYPIVMFIIYLIFMKNVDISHFFMYDYAVYLLIHITLRSISQTDLMDFFKSLSGMTKLWLSILAITISVFIYISNHLIDAFILK